MTMDKVFIYCDRRLSLLKKGSYLFILIVLLIFSAIDGMRCQKDDNAKMAYNTKQFCYNRKRAISICERFTQFNDKLIACKAEHVMYIWANKLTEPAPCLFEGRLVINSTDGTACLYLVGSDTDGDSVGFIIKEVHNGEETLTERYPAGYGKRDLPYCGVFLLHLIMRKKGDVKDEIGWYLYQKNIDRGILTPMPHAYMSMPGRNIKIFVQMYDRMGHISNAIPITDVRLEDFSGMPYGVKNNTE